MVRFKITLDSRMGSLVTGPTRFFLSHHSIPQRMSRFISERIRKAVTRLLSEASTTPIPVKLTLQSRAERVHVVLQADLAPSRRRGLATLVKDAPRGVQATYRPGPKGATLRFVAGPLRQPAPGK